jgi:hypothetical protein
MPGTYIDTDDLNNVFGTINIAAWSDLTGGRTADSIRIEAAIAYGEQRVENRFRRSRYVVPFAAVDGGYDAALTYWMAVYAGDWLYQSRNIRRGAADTDRTSALLDRIEAEINEVLAGQSVLNAGLVSSSAPTAPHVVTAGTNAGTRDDYGSYNFQRPVC